ncbi:MAG: hypothetical protein ACYC09_12965 [Bacteroidota bacterium]
MITKAPLVKRAGDTIYPVSRDLSLRDNANSHFESMRIVDNSQTVIEGLFTSVIEGDIVEDTGAVFTPDLIGKTIVRLTSTANTNTDGTVSRAMDGSTSWFPAATTIVEVISATRLRLAFQLFSPTSSKYYAIDNHSGKILSYVEGFITTDAASSIVDANANFDESLIGKYAITTNGEVWWRQIITAVPSATELTLDADMPTSVGAPYKIILTDDAYRFISSAVDDVAQLETVGVPASVILKDGTYREFVQLRKRSNKSTGIMFAISIVGDNNYGTKTIIKGSYATADTTKVFLSAFTYTGVHLILLGLTCDRFSTGVFSLYNGLALADKCTFKNMVDIAENANSSIVTIANSVLNTISGGLLNSNGISQIQINGTVEFQTNIDLIHESSRGLASVFYNSCTITGAGAVTIGSTSALVNIMYFGATAPPHLTDSSGAYQKYLETTKTAATATAGAGTLPAAPEGFIEVYVNGALKKIPYYNT